MVRITGVDAGGIEELDPLPIVARHRIGTDIGINGDVLLPRQYALPCSFRVPGIILFRSLHFEFPQHLEFYRKLAAELFEARADPIG